MGKIIDGKYKKIAGKEEFTEGEYTKLRKEHPEIELKFADARTLIEYTQFISQMKARKTVIAARLSDIGIILQETPIGITEVERKLTLQAEETNLRAELAYINNKLEG